MGNAKKSAFAGQGKGWRKGVKGIGLKKKPTDGELVVSKSQNRNKHLGDAEGRRRGAKVKRERQDGIIPVRGDDTVSKPEKLEEVGRKEGLEDTVGASGSDTETDSGVEDLPRQCQPRKAFEPGPPLGANLGLQQFPSDLESEGSADDQDERTLEGRATVRRRGAREMGDLYRDECLAFCGELLTLQEQWKQAFGSPAPGYVSLTREPLIDESREAPSSAPPSEPPPYVALFKQFHARELPTLQKPRWQKSKDGNMFKRGESGKLVIRRKKLKKKKRRHGERGDEARVGGGVDEAREATEGVLVRRRKTRKDKGVAKTHGKYAKEKEDGQEGETMLVLTPEEEDLANLRRMIHNELAASVETGPIDASRSRAPWTEQEREAFKRSLFLFGLGRLQKVHRHMTQSCKKSQQQLGDISDACYVLLEQCLAHIAGSDLTSTQKRMQDLIKRKARGDDVETGPEVTTRVGVFAKLPTNAKSWVRRLQLLDGLDHALHVCGSRTTQSDAFKIILLIAEDGTKPAPWWTRNADIALMLGVYRHGYANYDAVKLDPEFAEAFAPALEAEGPSEKVRRKRRRKKQSDGDGEDIDGEGGIDGGGLVADSFIESLVEGDLDSQENLEVGAAEPSILAPPLQPKLSTGNSGEKRRMIDLDLNAPAEDSSPRGGEDPGTSEAPLAVGGLAGEGHVGLTGKVDKEGFPPETSELDAGDERGSGKKKRKGAKEEGEEEGGDEKSNPGGWPASVPLTLRLKRLISHLAKGLKRPVGIILQKEEAPAAQAASKAAGRPTWSKKEKQDVVRALTAFGLPETPGGRADWRQLLKVSGLPKKAESSAVACFEELLAEATAVLRDNKALRKRQRKPIKHMWTCTCSHCKQKRLESLPSSQQKAQKREGHGGELGPRTLINVIAAKKLLDRIETLEVLRKALAVVPGDWTNKELGFYRTSDLPRWWRAGLHDREYSLGLIKHGIGNWAAIGSDPDLAFPQPEDFKNEEGGGEGGPVGLEALPPTEEPPAKEATAAKDDDPVPTLGNGGGDGEEAGGEGPGKADGTEGGQEGSLEPPGGGWAFPGSKVLLRRLKYNAQILKRMVARHQKKAVPPTGGDPRPKIGKALKRQGQESAVDGARKPAKRKRSNNDDEKGPAASPILETHPAVQDPSSHGAALTEDPQAPTLIEETVAGHDRNEEEVEEDAGMVSETV